MLFFVKVTLPYFSAHLLAHWMDPPFFCLPPARARSSVLPPFCPISRRPPARPQTTSLLKYEQSERARRRRHAIFCVIRQAFFFFSRQRLKVFVLSWPIRRARYQAGPGNERETRKGGRRTDGREIPGINFSTGLQRKTFARLLGVVLTFLFPSLSSVSS